MSLALYRKYRPQTFGEFIGQEHIVQTLINSILAGRIGHAYLFAGPKGSGKTTVARLFAKAINCQNIQKFEPCNQCSSCLEITEQRAIDLVEIDAASHRGIDEMRELINGIRFPPVKAKYKIFIVDESHQITKDAANALLKTLEEPPSYTIFILATTEAHKMIPTIVSRCQRFDFRQIKIPEIIKKLKVISERENIQFEDSALSLIALNSGGSFRDAESLMDNCISFVGQKKLITAEDIKKLLGIVEISQVSKFVNFLSQKNQKNAIFMINEMMDNGIDLQEFTKTLIYYLRHSLLLKIHPDFLKPETSGFSREEIEKIKIQNNAFDTKKLQKILELFIEAENKIKYTSIPQLPLELATFESIELLNK